jgi:hypothetical protein
MELCPKIMKDGEKLGFLGVPKFWGETMKMGVKKGRRWCGGEWWWLRDAVVVMGSGEVAWGGVWRWFVAWVCCRKERRWGKWVYGTGEMKKEGRESDLKAGHVRPKNECDRTYRSAFNRIRVECVCRVGSAFERTRCVRT